jgi:DNA-binding MarR family transcriptional regulator
MDRFSKMPASSAARRDESSTTSRAGDAADQQRDIRLGFLIHDVSRMRRSAFDSFMRPLGITRAQWWVIAHLSRQDGMMQIQLADILDVGKASLGTVIDRLEASGLVERRPDPVDRRANRLFMTRKSHRMIDRMQAAERHFSEQSLRRLSAAEREELARMLSLVRADLVDMNKDGGESDRTAAEVKPGPRRRRRATSRA